MNKLQEGTKNLLEADGWEIFQPHFKDGIIIMQKQIDKVIVYLSIKKDGTIHFNRRK